MMTDEITLNAFQAVKTVVIKLGSAVLTNADGDLDLPVMRNLCAEVAGLLHRGRKVIVVTSGAVAAGRGALKENDRRPTIAVKQALAAVGQSRLMQLYTDFFGHHGIVVGQMLLSRSDMEDRRRYVNARYTLEELLNRGCVPIINENDTVTVDELRFGDNDGLAALLAVKMRADALLLLSDVDGLYDCNPKTNPSAKLLERVDCVTPEMLATADDTNCKGPSVGSGGMTSKLLAAQLATREGVWAAIAQGKKSGVISQVLSGTFRGTLFLPQTCRRSRREQWMVSGKTHGRRVVLDDGACEALLVKKKSLLPAGVRSVEGEFQQHDLVEITNGTGKVLGRGIVNYSSAELQKIAGRKTAEIMSILGSKPYDEAIHRDNMALGE
jgi:glutamate 5-kinase